MTPNKRVAVITGGAQGIGRIIAGSLINAGYGVSVWDNDREALEEEKEKIAGSESPEFCLCDVSVEEEVKMALENTLNRFGRIDVLVHNAAISANKPIGELEVQEFNHVISVNLSGAFICAKYCEPELRKNKGTIINLCSTRAFQSEAHTEAYSASKGGIFSLTHSLAVSLGPEVRVNSISPGWIDVSAIRKSSTAKQELLSEADHLQHPAGRVGEPGDIARMVLFLCNPENSFITGQNFVIDGGMTRKMIYV
jgi:NAD(P)-dependent dehydrogenase (short-subunit alcohol dehydrogenase family)